MTKELHIVVGDTTIMLNEGKVETLLAILVRLLTDPELETSTVEFTITNIPHLPIQGEGIVQ